MFYPLLILQNCLQIGCEVAEGCDLVQVLQTVVQDCCHLKVDCGLWAVEPPAAFESELLLVPELPVHAPALVLQHCDTSSPDNVHM